MNKKITIIGILLLIVVVVIGFTLVGKNKEETSEQEKLSLAVDMQEKEIEQGKELTFQFEIKNGNVKDFKREIDPSCEHLWAIEIQKDGETIEKGHGECLESETAVIEMKSLEAVNYIVKKEMSEPGEYKAIIKTFGQEIEKEFTIK